MKKIIGAVFLFFFLTLFTQVGGVVFVFSKVFCSKMKWELVWKKVFAFFSLYMIFSLVIVPVITPIFGREGVKHSNLISPTNYLTVLLNRNYVNPEFNVLLESVEKSLSGTDLTINYLDANFPFFDGFPLLPHLSHSDGRKLDLSFIYEYENGELSDLQKSNSGYGAFSEPEKGETDQIGKCIDAGYFQYSFSKFLTFGKINREVAFSEKGTKKLIQILLKHKSVKKIFIEPHLKSRMNLNYSKMRYHGCRAVRHDDHIHIEI